MTLETVDIPQADVLWDVAPMAVYSVGFFFFWCLCALASMLTYYLVVVPDEQARF